MTSGATRLAKTSGATRLEMTSGAAGSDIARNPVRVLLVPDIKFFISRFLLIPPDTV
jgi:hypothetical protein